MADIPTHNSPSEPTPEEKARGARAQVILYVVMGIFVLLPFLVYWLRKGR